MHNKEMPSSERIPTDALDQLFRIARTYRAWRHEQVAKEVLRELYDLTALGPTSANSSPARFVFIISDHARQRLLPCLDPGNVEKTRTAPVVVIVAYDTEFHEKLPALMPGVDMRSRFVGRTALIEETAFRNSSLQGAYLIMAARALGLDAGPMSGFDHEKLNHEFFPDGRWKANFVCNLGHGDGSKMPPRAPRLPFEEACQVL